jgi:hypothetical protein
MNADSWQREKVAAEMLDALGGARRPDRVGPGADALSNGETLKASGQSLSLAINPRLPV